ncbi:GNAT family N-acetyltransferase [Persicobacter sp. CCB-QB2]|uniref:GNAT family N-acetyltransferase n=1 Tax=Persicobacter sp. CCB-QB2 TaxID=1561025 RepID=UPI0006A9A5C3|nr:GNAT family N-acetyltransferase [Persicobacter sp. CCB-QB2]
MLSLLRTDSSHQDFLQLVQNLDQDLAIRNGEDNAFYAQFNKVDAIPCVVVAFLEGKPAGCGAMKFFSPGKMEIKRMFTLEACRGKGVASAILKELEQWAEELGMQSCVLETGIQQPEAIGLYQKQQYQRIPNYGPYAMVEDSLCFEKQLAEI